MTPLPNPIDYHIYTGEPLPAPALYAYILAGQGVIKMAHTPHFEAAIVTAGMNVAGLPIYPVGIELHRPLIPAVWLYRVLQHARLCGDGIEQMYHFHWWPQSSGPGFALLGRGYWRVSIPKQQATPLQVGYRGGHESTVVLDLHSHHRMETFFSSTDDADEQGMRFYAVIGRISPTTWPEIRLRIGVYGDWMEISPLVLFEGLGPFRKAE